MSARDDVISGLAEHACCFSEEDAERRVDAHRDEVALAIGRDVLRDGLVSTLNRLVGEANATKVLADYRAATAHELAEQQRAVNFDWYEDDATGAYMARAHLADLIDPLKGTPR